MKVVVIGAGVIGSAVARELVRRGDDVTVVESGTPGSGTSRTSFAWVNANTKEPLPYFLLNQAGTAAHREFAQIVGTAPWWFPSGNLEWAISDADIERLNTRVSRLRERGYAARWLTRDEAAALEPDLRLPDTASFAFFADEAHCFPILLLAHMLGQAYDGGARLRLHSPVAAVEVRPGGARVVLNDAAEPHIDADKVVCCTGRWTSDLLGPDAVPMLGPGRNEAATLGYLATTTMVPARLSRVVSTPSLNLRPGGAGHLVLQGLDLDPEATPDPLPDRHGQLARTMLARAESILPCSRGADVADVVLGRRAMPADGLTVAGFIDDSERVYAVATHSGVTLGPLLGNLAASELHGQVSELLEPFRPDRFNTKYATSPTQPRRAGEQ